MEMWENALQKLGNVDKKWEMSISTQLYRVLWFVFIFNMPVV